MKKIAAQKTKTINDFLEKANLNQTQKECFINFINKYEKLSQKQFMSIFQKSKEEVLKHI